MPRPKIYNTKFQLNFTKYDFEFLREQAIKEQITMSDIIRRLVRNYEQKNKSG